MKTSERKILIHDINKNTCAFCGFPAVIDSDGSHCPNCNAKYYHNRIFSGFVWELTNAMICPVCSNEMHKIVYNRWECPNCLNQIVESEK